MLYLREIKEGKKPETFLDDITVTSKIDKAELWSHIQYEFGDMEVLPPTVAMFTTAVKGFFKHWNPKIEELAKTLEYEYDPLRDYYANSDLNSERDVNRDYTSDINRDYKSDVNRDYTSNIERDYTSDFKQDDKAQEKYDDDTTLNRTYSEDVSTNSRQNLRVSAYNQEYAEETEKDWGRVPNYDGRDLTLEAGEKNTTGNENTVGTDDSTTDNTLNRVTKTTDNEVRDTTDNEVKNTKDNEVKNTKDNEVTDDDYKSHKVSYGTSRHAYQDLILKQREVVQFDLCRWIMNKWSQELMIAVW